MSVIINRIRNGMYALRAAHLPSRANTKNRLADSIEYAFNSGKAEHGVQAFLEEWVARSNGSSAFILSNFMLATTRMTTEEAIIDTAEKLKSRYNESPKPLGMMLGFHIIAAMSRRNPDRTLVYKEASTAISIIAKSHDDIGFRCFAAFLEGFTGAIV